MTIRRGEEWGSTVARPPTLVAAASDAELARLVAADPAGAYTLSGGDLFRSLGAPPHRDPVQRLPVDALLVTIGEQRVVAVAHVLVRRGWWRGPLLAVMNCDHMGDWNVAPRAHPNDGRLDVVEVAAAMSPRRRMQARSRLAAGTHVPHPDITVRAAVQGEWAFTRPMGVFVDGVHAGTTTRLEVAIAPDHFAIHV